MQKKSDRDWRNAIFIDEWTFYLKPSRKKEIYKKGNSNFKERRKFKQKINQWGFSSNGKCILNFQRKYEQHYLWKYIGGLYARVEENWKN